MAIGRATTGGHEKTGHAPSRFAPDGAKETTKRARFRTPRALSAALRGGDEISDEDYNYFLPQRFQGGPYLYATPVPVAVRATQLLTEGHFLRVLDIGAGVGTFCIIGALTTPAFFMGLEPESPLVLVARGAGARFGAERARFFRGSVAKMDFRLFDAIYLFDSAVRRIENGSDQVDDGAAGAPMTDSDGLTWRKLGEARKGTRILTYCGRRSPCGCRVLKKELVGSSELVLFVKE